MKKSVVILLILLFLNINYSIAKEISQEDIQRYSAYYSNGMHFFKNQQFSSAITEFKKVLRFSPYDKTAQNALANAYYSRAEYYRKQTKEVRKALVDYKSAYFYAKYWQDNNQSSDFLTACLNEINEFEKRLSISTTASARIQNANAFKTQGELAAAGYELEQIKSSNYKEIAYENLGNIYKNLNNLAKAMDYFKMAIDINPKNPKTHFLYGVMLDEAGNYEAGVEEYNLALQYVDKNSDLLEILENKWIQDLVKNPNNSQSYVNLGVIYQKKGEYEEAKTQYLKALNLNPDDEVILYNLASLFMEQKKNTEALNIYNNILAKNPKNIDSLEYKAQILKNLNKPEEAISVYENILTLQPDNKNAKNNIDDIILNHFSGEKLQNYLEKIALNKPYNYEAQFNCALEFHKNKNYPKAIEYYNKAISINQAKEESYINLTQIYIEQKNYSKANEIATKGLVLFPQSERLSQYSTDIKNYKENKQYNFATKLYEQKNYKQAIAEYSKIQNQNDDVKAAIASCYWELKDYQNANKYYIDILKRQPDNINYLLYAAWTYYSLKDFTNAKILVDKILLLDRVNTDAKELLSGIEQAQASNFLETAIHEYEKGNFTSALSSLNTYLSKNSNDEYAIYYKGLTLDELKKTQEAIKQYKALLLKNPNFIDAYYSLAVDLDSIENYKEAIINYEKYLSLKQEQDDDTTKYACTRIDELKKYLADLNK